MDQKKDTNYLNSVINAVAHDKTYINGSFHDVVGFILEQVANALQCERVSVWEYNESSEKHIICIDHWNNTTKTHTADMVLGEKDAFSYLNALDKDMVLVMDDVATDPRCKELFVNYLPENNITSMLDAPYQFDGHLAGVICCEHVGSARKWTVEHSNFCSNVGSLLSIVIEREKRKKITLELENEKNLLRTLTDSSPDGIVIFVDKIFEYVNPTMQKFADELGLGKLLGRAIKDVTDEETSKVVYARHDVMLKTKGGLPAAEYSLTGNGQRKILETISTYTKWNGKDAIQSIFRDTTAQVKTRKSLEVYAKQMSTLVELYPGGFIYIDTHKKYRRANSRFLDWNGIDSLPAEGVKMEQIETAVSIKELSEAYDDVLKGNGRIIEIALDYPVKGSMYAEISLVPDRSSSGRVRGIFSLIDDISERKNAENTLRNAHKMEAIGQLTGGIAHDFNNMLMIVMGNLELLRESIGADQSSLAFLDNAYQASNRGADVTKKLLRFSRKKETMPEEIDINEVLTNLLELLGKTLTASINIALDLSPGLPSIMVSKGDFEDSLLNLLLNARDAMDGHGTITIKTSKKITKDNQTEILLSIKDNGSGIPKEIKDRIFEPFFSTKNEEKGTGLGLSMVYGFVQRSGATITVNSHENQGTEFLITFPGVAQNKKQDSVIQQHEQLLQIGKETILLVDDEQELISVLIIMLETAGYKTLSANSADEAMKIIADNSHIDLLLSDIVLGGSSDGYELITGALKIKPALKTLLMSGFNNRQEQFDTDSATKFPSILKKPFTKESLLRAVSLSLVDK